MSNYYLANDISFLAGMSTKCKSPSSATHMKLANAQEFVKQHPQITYFKARGTSATKKDYVLCTPMKFVGHDLNIVSDIKKARAFKSEESALDYLKMNAANIDDDICFVIDDKFRRKRWQDNTIEDIEPAEVFSFANMDTSERIYLPAKIKEEVYNRSNGVCPICGKQMSKYVYTVDHIIPLSRGGTNEITNLRAVHKDCNRFKGNFLDDEFMNLTSTVACNNIVNNPNSELTAMVLRSFIRGVINSI